MRDLEQEILSRIFEEQRSDSLTAILNRAGRSAAQVRDRLSADLLRVVNQFSAITRGVDNPAWGYVSVGDALAVLNGCIGTLAALRGIEMENMTRGPGWRFLSIGRRIERSVQLVTLVPNDHRAAEPADLAGASNAARSHGQFHVLPFAILHDSAARTGARSFDE